MTKKIIPWNEIHQHLVLTQQLIDGKDKSSDDVANKLHQRANELAKAVTRKVKHLGTKVIEFRLGPESYGIEIMNVSKVCRAKEIIRLPGTPSFVEGVINIHGMVVCVINLKTLFGLQSEAPMTGLNRVIILNNDETTLGIIADEVIHIQSVAEESLQKSLPNLTGIRAEFLLGVTHDQKIILNARKILAHKEFIINEYV